MSMNTREKVLELRLKGLGYSEIGRQVGISRQRAHQIITGYTSFATRGLSFCNYPKLSSSFKNGCDVCGERFVQVHHKDGNSSNNNKENLMNVCSRCHHNLHKIAS